MQFIHIIPDTADPRSVNGVNKVVHSMATTQSKMGVSTQVWSIVPDAKDSTHEHDYPLRVFPQAKYGVLLPEVLRKAIDELPVDTWVQLHSIYAPVLTPIARRLKRRSIPYGVTPHGGYLSLYTDSPMGQIKKKIFASLWENWMLRNASVIHVIGPTEIADLKRRAPETKHVIIPNGYAPAQLGTLGPRQEMKPASIMFCGRHVSRQKGLDLLIEGFAKYRRQGGTLNLVLIAGGKDNASLRNLATQLGVAQEISWPGVLPVDELRSTLRGAAAFVHTSRYDVLPTACLEAAALGLPLFVSEETNFGEYVKPRNGGWVYGPNSPDMIAETMFLIEKTSSADRLAMGENARRMIHEELNWEIISTKLSKMALDYSGRRQTESFSRAEDKRIFENR